MELYKAPAIVGTIQNLHTMCVSSIMSEAAAKIRREYDAAPADGGSLRKIAQDIWALKDRPVGLHTDATRQGYWVFGVVLINEPGLMLYTNEVVYDLPVGTIYAIDGRKKHGALSHNGETDGLFAFLAWDVDKHTSTFELIDDFLPALKAWTCDEERVNVA